MTKTVLKQNNIIITIVQKEQEPYLSQYCNLKETNIDFEILSEKKRKRLINLKEKARLQSGLTDNELTLIALCRYYDIFTEVNTFMHRVVDKIRDNR